MDFKFWLEARSRWPTAKDIETTQNVIAQFFPTAEFKNYRTTKVWLAELPTGQKITVSVYEDKPKQVKLGFYVDHSVRATYGQTSPKDVASNVNLMPGTLSMMRLLRGLVNMLQNSGLKVIYDPIDERRDRFYRKVLATNSSE